MPIYKGLQGDFYRFFGFQSHGWFADGKLFVSEINVNLDFEDDNGTTWELDSLYVRMLGHAETTSWHRHDWFIKSIINLHQPTITFYKQLKKREKTRKKQWFCPNGSRCFKSTPSTWQQRGEAFAQRILGQTQFLGGEVVKFPWEGTEKNSWDGLEILIYRYL